MVHYTNNATAYNVQQTNLNGQKMLQHLHRHSFALQKNRQPTYTLTYCYSLKNHFKL